MKVSDGPKCAKRRIWFTLGALLVYRLGTFIPIPGVGTAIGGALGTLASRAIKGEQELDEARRFVRLTGTAGLRLDHHEAFGAFWSPSMAAAWWPAHRATRSRCPA